MIIRPVTKDDLEWLREQRNRPEINFYFNQYDFISKEEQNEWYEKDVLTKKFYAFIIEDTSFKKIGYVGLKTLNWILRSAEFSIFVIPEEQKKGYGKEALREILRFGFENLNFHRIYSTVFDFNKAIEVYKKVGFEVEGMLRDTCFKKGRYWNSYYISMLEDEYKKLYHSK